MARPTQVNADIGAFYSTTFDFTPGVSDYVGLAALATTTPPTITWRDSGTTSLATVTGMQYDLALRAAGAASGGSGSGTMAGFGEYAAAQSFLGVVGSSAGSSQSGDMNGTPAPISISVAVGSDDLIGWVLFMSKDGTPPVVSGTANTTVTDQVSEFWLVATGTSTGNINLSVTNSPYEWHVAYYILHGESEPSDELSIDSQPSSGTSGSPLASIVVESTDAGFTGSVTATIQSGSGVLSGTTAVNAVAGVATFSNLIITGTGAHTLRFSASGYDPVDSSSITISAAPSGGRFRPYFVRH